MLNLGFKNFIAKNKIVSIISTNSAPSKKIIAAAQDNGTFVDATEGRRRKSLVITETHVIISAIDPGTLVKRFEEMRYQNAKAD